MSVEAATERSFEPLASTYVRSEEGLAGRAIIPAGRNLLYRGSEEAANSAYLLNTMDDDGSTKDDPTEDELRSPSMQTELETFGQDLVDRSTGALFAQAPVTPTPRGTSVPAPGRCSSR